MYSTIFQALFIASLFRAIEAPVVEPKEASKTIVAANNQFAFNLYQELLKGSENENQFISPHSIHIALSMTAEGATENTLNEMLATLCLPDNAETRRTGYAQLLKSISGEGKPYQLATANAIWPEKSSPLIPSFPGVIKDIYQGGIFPQDYVGNYKGARTTINKWVEAQTNNRIKDLIPEGAITPSTRMVLTNAIFFKGNWSTEFDSTLTNDEQFYMADGSQQTVRMMNGRYQPDQCRYNEIQGAQVLELPYEGDDLSMVIVLPESGKMGEMEESLSSKNWERWTSGLAPMEVIVAMPKFKMELGKELSDPLKALGMKDAFDPAAARFGDMFQKEAPVISAVIHKAFVEVNETGTEAAAATAVIMVETSSSVGTYKPVKYFRADRPFLFAIQQKSTGAILFLGKMEKPE